MIWMAQAHKSALDPLEQYQHEKQQRLNNPPVGLVTPSTDIDGESKTYQYDPHLDPQLFREVPGKFLVSFC